MRLRFLARWRSWRTGDIGELPDGMANVLVRRGIAEKVGHVEPDVPPEPVGQVNRPARRSAMRRSPSAGD